jgi:hypothetical protein
VWRPIRITFTGDSGHGHVAVEFVYFSRTS